ncbi:hypothetical protein [Streptomyces griseoluteus]|uniref:hypothetical protein n=1 Tax=Streptomyces griseoluteus TaxID=29306 RepID=UPI003803E0A4
MIKDLLPRGGGVSSVELVPGDTYFAQVDSAVDVTLGDATQILEGVYFVRLEQARIAFQDLFFDGMVDDYFAFEFWVFVEECLFVFVVGGAADGRFFSFGYVLAEWGGFVVPGVLRCRLAGGEA